MPNAVLDANVAIGLAQGGVFELLQNLYAPLCVPPAVVREVIVQGQGQAGAAELQRALGQWVLEVAPNPQRVQQFSPPLPPADGEVLALAVERSVDFILSGDRAIQREAQQQGLTSLSAAQVVVLMKDAGLIPALRPVLDRMRQQGFGISTSDYQQALKAAGE